MLQNGYLLAKIGADTAENEHHFAEICQKLATTLPTPDAAGDCPVPDPVLEPDGRAARNARTT